MTGLLTFLLHIHKSAALSFPILFSFLIRPASSSLGSSDDTLCWTKSLDSGANTHHLRSKLGRILFWEVIAENCLLSSAHVNTDKTENSFPFFSPQPPCQGSQMGKGSGLRSGTAWAPRRTQIRSKRPTWRAPIQSCASGCCRSPLWSTTLGWSVAWRAATRHGWSSSWSWVG